MFILRDGRHLCDFLQRMPPASFSTSHESHTSHTHIPTNTHTHTHTNTHTQTHTHIHTHAPTAHESAQPMNAACCRYCTMPTNLHGAYTIAQCLQNCTVPIQNCTVPIQNCTVPTYHGAYILHIAYILHSAYI